MDGYGLGMEISVWFYEHCFALLKMGTCGTAFQMDQLWFSLFLSLSQFCVEFHDLVGFLASLTKVFATSWFRITSLKFAVSNESSCLCDSQCFQKGSWVKSRAFVEALLARKKARNGSSLFPWQQIKFGPQRRGKGMNILPGYSLENTLWKILFGKHGGLWSMLLDMFFAANWQYIQ